MSSLYGPSPDTTVKLCYAFYLPLRDQGPFRKRMRTFLKDHLPLGTTIWLVVRGFRGLRLSIEAICNTYCDKMEINANATICEPDTRRVDSVLNCYLSKRQRLVNLVSTNVLL